MRRIRKPVINRKALLEIAATDVNLRGPVSARFQYFSQDADKLCWAACIEMLLGALRNTLRSQCSIAQAVVANPKCRCDKGQHPSDDCNVPIDPQTIPTALGAFGLTCNWCAANDETALKSALMAGLVLIYWSADSGEYGHMGLVVDRDTATGLYMLADPLLSVGHVVSASFSELGVQHEMSWDRSWGIS